LINGLLQRFCLTAAARGDYAELEQLVAGQLAGLARDASWLKSYLVASLLLGKEAMQVRLVLWATFALTLHYVTC
jgi:hypothetical protein